MPHQHNLIFACVFALAPSVCVAASDEINSCVAISDDTERLKCYDDIAAPPTTEKVKREPNSEWNVYTQKSEMDDSLAVIAIVVSDDQFQGPYGIKPTFGSLGVRCVENTTSILIGLGDYQLADHGGYGVIEYRLDSDAPKSKSFEASTDSSRLGLWNGGQAIPFIKAMFGKEKLTVRITPFSQTPVTTSFNITGLEQEIAPLREACHW
ncbi:MAG: type VI secretion system-associated protein TagO [Puniceicoccales bacterium]